MSAKSKQMRLVERINREMNMANLIFTAEAQRKASDSLRERCALCASAVSPMY